MPSLIEQILQLRKQEFQFIPGVRYNEKNLTSKIQRREIGSWAPKVLTANYEDVSVFSTKLDRSYYTLDRLIKSPSEFIFGAKAETVGNKSVRNFFFYVKIDYPISFPPINKIVVSNTTEFNLLLYISQNSEIMKKLAAEMKIQVKMFEADFLDFLYCYYSKYPRVTNPVEDYTIEEIADYARSLTTAFMSHGMCLHALLGGERVMSKISYLEKKPVTPRFLEIYESVRRSRPFGLLLAYNSVIFNSNKYQAYFESPMTLVSHKMQEEELTSGDGEKAHTYIRFLLEIENYEHLIFRLKEFGFFPQTDNLLNYVYHNIHKYNNVFNRAPELPNPMEFMKEENLKYLGTEEFHKFTTQYTDFELLTNFRINAGNMYYARGEFRIELEQMRQPKWRLVYYGCTGLEMVDEYISFEGYEVKYQQTLSEITRGEDIIISYGDFFKHRCFTLVSLLSYISTESRTFRVPGYLPEEKRGSNYPDDFLKDQEFFTNEQGKELTYLISFITAKKEIKNATLLFDRLKEVYFASVDPLADYKKSINEEFAKLNPRQQAFIPWIFYRFIIVAMYGRRWHGPGEPYPYHFYARGIENPQRCSSEKADQEATINLKFIEALRIVTGNTVNEDPANVANSREYLQSIAGGIFGENIDFDNEEIEGDFRGIYDFYQKLTLIAMRNQNFVIHVGSDSPVHKILRLFVNGEYCASNLSDTLLYTGIYHLMTVLNKDIGSINTDVRSYISSEFGLRLTDVPEFSLAEFNQSGHPNIGTQLEVYNEGQVNRLLSVESRKYEEEFMLSISDNCFFWSNNNGIKF